MWLTVDKKVWIPENQQLKKCVYAVAHQGVAGHRGHKVTMAILKSRVWWPKMDADVTRFRRGCLHCIKNANGDMVPMLS